MPRIKRRGAKRPHSEHMLAAKKAARALGVNWGELCEERDKLRDAELEQRNHAEEARRVAWHFWCARAGRASSQRPFWRSGFLRVFGRKLANGCDYLCVPYADETAETVRQSVPEFCEAETGDIFDLLLSPYEPRSGVDAWYQLALANVLAGRACVAPVEVLATPF